MVPSGDKGKAGRGGWVYQSPNVQSPDAQSPDVQIPQVQTPHQGRGEHLRLPSNLLFPLIGLGVWAYFGFPTPDTLMRWYSAKEDCVNFAEKHKEQLFATLDQSNQQIRAVGSWMKNGRVVVEIGSFKDNEGTYIPRLCVIGGDSIQIVSILENAAWR